MVINMAKKQTVDLKNSSSEELSNLVKKLKLELRMMIMENAVGNQIEKKSFYSKKKLLINVLREFGLRSSL